MNNVLQILLCDLEMSLPSSSCLSIKFRDEQIIILQIYHLITCLFSLRGKNGKR